MKRARCNTRTGSFLVGVAIAVAAPSVTAQAQTFRAIAAAGARLLVPKDVAERLHQEILRAVANPKVAQLFINIGTQPATSTADEFRAFIQSEIDKWTKVMKAANIGAN